MYAVILWISDATAYNTYCRCAPTSTRDIHACNETTDAHGDQALGEPSEDNMLTGETTGTRENNPILEMYKNTSCTHILQSQYSSALALFIIKLLPKSMCMFNLSLTDQNNLTKDEISWYIRLRLPSERATNVILRQMQLYCGIKHIMTVLSYPFKRSLFLCIISLPR